MFPWICIKSVCRLHHPTQTLPGWLLVPMLPQNATSPPVPTHSTLPPGVAEFLTSLFQNGTLPLPSAGQTPVPPASSTPPPGIPPPAEGRSFTRPGRGEGGVLVQKQKVSKQITTSAIKRKALVDSDVETLPPSTSGSVTKSAGTRPSAKRIKTTKVRHYFRFFSGR